MTAITTLITTLGFTIAFLMAIGAVFAPLKHDVSAVAPARGRSLTCARSDTGRRRRRRLDARIAGAALVGGTVGGALAYWPSIISTRRP